MQRSDEETAMTTMRSYEQKEYKHEEKLRKVREKDQDP